jgi:hypothetical protein
MISTRHSGARQRNHQVSAVADRGTSNRGLYRDNAVPGSILLLGGSSVVHFRLRVAQSHLRHDLLPSFWSLAGMVVSADRFLSVPIGLPMHPDTVPARNAVEECSIGDFDDPVRFPNIAVISFADGSEGLVDLARRLRYQRAAIDLPQQLVQWLAFVWGVGATGNPLLQNVGMPSAGLIEAAFGMAGVELTPGVASQASCPEGIWQSAIWWHGYYEKTGASPAPAPARGLKAEVTARAPAGRYITRQMAAAVIEEEAPRKRSASTRRTSRTRGRRAR